LIALDAKTGAVKSVYPLVEKDYHDWDVSAAPSIITTRGGKRLIAEPIKDGHLHAIDAVSGKRVYNTAITTILNASAPLTQAGGSMRFCPGTQGGTEWNGAAYSPTTNLLYTGAVDWCTTVKVASDQKIKDVAIGHPWSGMDDDKAIFGLLDNPNRWAGWVVATNADTGRVAWRFRAPAPILAGVTATAGGLVFTGDMAGTLYAFDAKSGKRIWRVDTGGAIGGGVISYEVPSGAQRVAVATGMTSPIWPTRKADAKVIVYGLR
jgi:alcohol dehydrogenase (cytochrome c)